MKDTLDNMITYVKSKPFNFYLKWTTGFFGFCAIFITWQRFSGMYEANELTPPAASRDIMFYTITIIGSFFFPYTMELIDLVPIIRNFMNVNAFRELVRGKKINDSMQVSRNYKVIHRTGYDTYTSEDVHEDADTLLGQVSSGLYFTGIIFVWIFRALICFGAFMLSLPFGLIDIWFLSRK